MNGVTAEELAKKILDLLELEAGDPFEITKTRDGHVLLGKPL